MTRRQGAGLAARPLRFDVHEGSCVLVVLMLVKLVEWTRPGGGTAENCPSRTGRACVQPSGPRGMEALSGGFA